MIGYVKKLLLNDNAHAAGSAGDHAHGGFHAGSVQVGHLLLGDLAQIFLGQLGDLSLVGDAGAGLQAASLLDQNGSGGSLGDEREGTVGVNGDHHGDDQVAFVLGALIEFLGELHDVDTVLTQSGANRGSRSCLTGGNLQLNQTSYFLCHLEHLLIKMW